MGAPLAHIPDQAGDCHASYARHHAQTFIDVFAGLGIHPDRYYWMSDIYPTGQMDPFIRTALDRAAVVRDIYRRVANVQHPEHWLPLGVVCPDCGKVGTTIASDWDGETVSVACRAGPGDVGRRLRLDRSDRAVRRDGEAALEPRVGGPVEPVRRHDRAQRQGPRDGGRVPRPVRCHRARGVRPPAAAQLPVRVPEPRRSEDVHLEGRGCRRAHDRPGHPARAAALPVRPQPPRVGHRVRPGGHGRRPAAVRRVRPARRRHRRPRGEGRAAVGPRVHLPLLAPRPGRGPRGRRATPSGRRSATWPSSSRSRASTSMPG